MKNFKQIEELLKKERLTEEQLKKRIDLFTNLDHTVSTLINQFQEFKGIELYGSILNRKFNEKSDIDISTFWQNYNPGDPKNWKYLKECTLQKYVTDSLEHVTERRIHGGYLMYINDEYPTEIQENKIRLYHVGIPFGIVLGDETYINKLRIGVLKAIESSRRIKEWKVAQKNFDDWSHKDLSNPEKDYKLSAFQKLKKQYSE
jgi:predicted nucleotidyltransferase